jgi:hypothetical protein
MRLLSAILLAIVIGLGVSLWRSYGTLQPCGILEQDLAEYRATGQHGWLPANEIERMVVDMQQRYGALACVVGLGFLHADTITALYNRVTGNAG